MPHADQLGEFVELVNFDTGEILEIGHGGLYAPLPIPAYQVLSAAKEHIAKNVLVCIVSHLGKGGKRACPSYSTIARESGHSRGAIRSALQVLYDFGFLNVHQFTEGKRRRNVYYVQEAAYNHSKMSPKALASLPILGRCKRCGEAIHRGEYGQGINQTHHYGCGGVTTVPGTQLSQPQR